LSDDQIQWVRRRFKGNKVWLATDEKGRPLEKNGKLLIKYQVDQPYEYWVHARSVRPLDEIPDHMPDVKSRSRNKSRRRSRQSPDSPGSRDLRDGAIHIFTDGASSGNPGPAGIGVVLRHRDRVREISAYIGRNTNNVAELEAIRRGLQAVKRRDLPVRLYTDSSYALGLLSQGWKARKNTELVEDIRNLMKSFADLKLIKVKGHAGLEDNERADKLATSAVSGKH
jgi:ribonuclease HI